MTPTEAIAGGSVLSYWIKAPLWLLSGILMATTLFPGLNATAVAGYCAHFDVDEVSSVGVLPLHHVSGLMAWMRTVLTGGSYLDWEWKRLEGGDFPPRPAGAGSGYPDRSDPRTWRRTRWSP